MLERFGIPSLALATIMAVAAPTVTLAKDRDDHGRRDFDRHDVVRDDRGFRGGVNFGVGVYSTPAPLVTAVPAPVPGPTGYCDQYGVWHAY